MGLGLGAVLTVDDDRSAFGDFWYGPAVRAGSVTGPIDVESALTIPQFYAAVTYVAEDIAKMPTNMFEDLGKSGSQADAGHELQTLLHDQPNEHQTALEWKEMVTAFAMLRGRAVNEILYGPSVSMPGSPTRANVVGQLVPLHPDLVREEKTKEGRRFKYRDPKRGGDERTILPEDAFVVRGRQSRSVLDFAATNLNTTIAQERYAGFMFSRGAKHQGVIQAKGKLSDPTRRGLRKAIDEYAIDGPRAGRPLLLEDGMEWKDVSMTVRDSSLVELRQISIADACRWIRIPPHKIFDLSRSTNNNIESQGIDYVVDCLLAWAIRWEQVIWRDLIVDKRFFAKFNLDSLLRGDNEARSRAYALAIMWGWMTRNEVRSKEGFNPIEGLDDPLTPVNMTTDPDGQAKVVEFARPGGDAQARGRLNLLAADVAGRVVRREIAEVGRIAKRADGDQTSWRLALEAFYAEHRGQVAEQLHIPDHVARKYAAEQLAELVSSGPDVTDDWLTDRVAYLTDLAMDQKELAA